MPSMMSSDHKAPVTEEENWDALYARICVLAMKRSETLTRETGDEDAFDRGARCLRTLMGAAEIARRMKLQEEKETAADGGQQTEPIVTEEDVARVYNDVRSKVERAHQREQAARQSNKRKHPTADEVAQ